MWGWLGDVAGGIWDAVKGFFSDIWQFVKWLIHRVVSIIDFILTLLGIMWPKKIKVQGIVLLDERKRTVADTDDLQAVLDLADEVFRDQVNVSIESPAGRVTILPEAAPSNVLEVGCGFSIFLAQFTSVGAWFRSHCARTPAGTFFGYGAPVTVFAIRNVRGKRGCSPGFIADYVVLDPDALSGAEGSLLTAAHEIGHACDLWHDDDTLMQSDHGGRPRKLSRYQKAIFRTSPHVTYF